MALVVARRLFCGKPLMHSPSLRKLDGREIRDIRVADLWKKCEQFSFVHVDVGTGDGLFIYKLAKKRPEHLYIGLDSNASGMAHTAWKVKRKPSRGGLAKQNVELLHLAVENIPDGLTGIADCVTVNYPWGGLLVGLTTPDREIVANIAKMVRVGGSAFFHFNYSLYQDRSLVGRMNLPDLSQDRTLQTVIECVSAEKMKWIGKKYYQQSSVDTTWGKSLTLGSQREILTLEFIKGQFRQ